MKVNKDEIPKFSSLWELEQLVNALIGQAKKVIKADKSQDYIDGGVESLEAIAEIMKVNRKRKGKKNVKRNKPRK